MRNHLLVRGAALLGVCALIFGGGHPLFGQDDVLVQAADVQKASDEAQKASDQAQKASEQAQKTVDELQKVDELRRAVRLIHGSGDRDNLIFALADDVAEALPRGEYWLGVQVAAVPEVAKKQLAIDDGLAVEEVTQDSPAAKAEIKKFDILVKAGNAPLKNITDLVKAVDASEGKEIIITIVRDGKNQTIKVLPDKRPKSERPELGIEAAKRAIAAARPELAAEIKQLEEALEKLKSKAGKDGVFFGFAKPAVVAPRVDVRIPEMKLPEKMSEMIAKNWKTDFPKDLSVQINKEGNEPAKIHVKRGNKEEWEVTDDRLKDLPDDVRPHVERLMGKIWAPGMAGTTSRMVRVSPEGKVEGEVQISPQPPRPPVPPKPPTAPSAATPPKPPTAQANRSYSIRTGPADAEHLDAKLTSLIKALEGRDGIIERLDKKIDDLRKEVEELRKGK